MKRNTQKRYELEWVTDSLAVGQAPMSHEALDYIRRQGINAIMNLCAEFCDLHWIEADAGFDVYFYPIPDEEAPDLPGLEKALDWLDECLYLGKKAMVHCRFGVGRTGTVVNAYLLRKGLGHKLAGKKLKGLKSQPANFYQWWFLRKYGKREKSLTIREPSLETKHLVDLFPFFANYQALVELVDQRLREAGKTGLCGQGHGHCCRELVIMPLIEAVYLSHRMNVRLRQEMRQEVISRGVEVSRCLQKLEPGDKIDELGEDFARKYRQAEILCPLNESGLCLLFENRPIVCRLFDLPQEVRRELSFELQEGLDRLSGDVWFAFTSSFPGNIPLRFFLSEVVSGKYVQTFFHLLMQKR
ncbi:MAG: dual specificity protein phosphatase family protein [Deltaproteobacteria bacterium]